MSPNMVPFISRRDASGVHVCQNLNIWITALKCYVTSWSQCFTNFLERCIPTLIIKKHLSYMPCHYCQVSSYVIQSAHITFNPFHLIAVVSFLGHFKHCRRRLYPPLHDNHVSPAHTLKVQFRNPDQ